MKGFELEWESNRRGRWKGSLNNWPGGRTTMALIHPFPDRGEGIYLLTGAFICDENDGEEGPLDELKAIAQAGLDRAIAHAANLYYAYRHPIRPEAMSSQELLPILFAGKARLTMSEMIAKLTAMGAAEGCLDGMLEDLGLQPGVVTGEDDQDIFYSRIQFGAELIAAERARQVSEERWTADHDDVHDAGELIDAAIAYAESAGMQIRGNCGWDSEPGCWPWLTEWWKPTADPIRNLIKAGALIAAEIDRLQRKEGA